MTVDKTMLLDAALERLRELDELFGDLNVGVAAIHLDACIAALESRIAKARSGQMPVEIRSRMAQPANEKH